MISTFSFRCYRIPDKKIFPCNKVPPSARICENGTKYCNVKHTELEEQELYTRQHWERHIF